MYKIIAFGFVGTIMIVGCQLLEINNSYEQYQGSVVLDENILEKLVVGKTKAEWLMNHLGEPFDTRRINLSEIRPDKQKHVFNESVKYKRLVYKIKAVKKKQIKVFLFVHIVQNKTHAGNWYFDFADDYLLDWGYLDISGTILQAEKI